MDEYQRAHQLAKLTWMSGSIKAAQRRTRNQVAERAVVIRLWNEGANLAEIAWIIKRTVHYVSKYMQRFEYFYGKDAVIKRRIPTELPAVEERTNEKK